MECDPTLNEEVVKLTEPLFSGSGPEIADVPSKNMTVPVALVGVTVAMNVSGVPAAKAVSPTDSSSSTDVLALATVWINAVEGAPLKLASPLYWAVIEWVPAAKVEVLKLAVPPLIRGTLPEMAIATSKKITVPVADAGVTLAVKVRGAPNTEGSVPALRRRLTAEFTLGLFTVCDNGGDVAPLKVASPLYCAVMEWVPADNVEIAKLADPATTGTLPEMPVLLSKNTTLPAAELGATFAVKVRESPVRAGFVPAVKLTLMLVLPLTTF
jgi:hypothetical protein